MQLNASAPGSMMILGEYAVLYGHSALVCALDKRLHVTLMPRPDEAIHLFSDKYGHYHTSLYPARSPVEVLKNVATKDGKERRGQEPVFEKPQPGTAQGRGRFDLVKPFDFLLATLNYFATHLKQGCDIHIQSAFSDKIGFGSSAALVVASVAALTTWFNIKCTPLEYVQHARQIIQTVQGNGSGADVAASVYGGIVSYKMSPLTVERWPLSYPLVACYAGFKTLTPDAIRQVETRFVNHPHLFAALMQAIGQCAEAGIAALREVDWQALGNLLTIQQGLMETLGVNLPVLRQMVDILNDYPTLLGAKISGAGLGDCVLGLGQVNDTCMEGIGGASYIPVAISLQGVDCERS